MSRQMAAIWSVGRQRDIGRGGHGQGRRRLALGLVLLLGVALAQHGARSTVR
jgi:hypothetical protein